MLVTTWLTAVICRTAPSIPSTLGSALEPRAVRITRHCRRATSVSTSPAMSSGPASAAPPRSGTVTQPDRRDRGHGRPPRPPGRGEDPEVHELPLGGAGRLGPQVLDQAAGRHVRGEHEELQLGGTGGRLGLAQRPGEAGPDAAPLPLVGDDDTDLDAVVVRRRHSVRVADD